MKTKKLDIADSAPSLKSVGQQFKKSVSTTSGRKAQRSGKELKPKTMQSMHADAIVDWLAAGKTLRSYCRQDQSPSFFSVYDWMGKDEEFALRIARARDSGSDVIADQCIELADIEPTDQVQAAWRRTQIETRLKLLSKWSPKKYGDRTAVDHQGGVSLTVVTGVPQPDAITGRLKQIT